MHYRTTPSDLKVFRTRYGLSQAKLGHELGVTRSSVSRWERGAVRIPSVMHTALRGLSYIFANRKTSRRAKQRIRMVKQQRKTLDRSEALASLPDHIRITLDGAKG